MIGQADVVIIGSGAFGASLAFHLAKAGRRSVALLDKAGIGGQTSWRAAGLSGQIRGSEALTRLAALSVKKVERFVAETDEPITFFQPGSLKIARLPQHHAQLKEQVELGKKLGLDVEFISPKEARDMMPFLETNGILAVTYMRTDIYLEPSQIPMGYSRAAEKRGATLLPNTEVQAITIDGENVTGVITDKGNIKTPIVVDAAGCWLRIVAEFAGIRVPVMPTRHQLLVSEPLADVHPDLPITRIIDANVYIRPDRGGLMFGGYEANPIQYDMRAMPKNYRIDDLELDLTVLQDLADQVRDQFPVLQNIKVREHRGGLPTMTPDGGHVIGPAPGVSGLYVAGGCCVGGLLIAPIVGELLADWIISGRAPRELATMSPTRPALAISEDDLKAQCKLRYSHHYWSAESVRSATAM